MSIHFVAGSEFVELPRPEHNFVWQSSIQIFIYVFWHLLPAGMLKYLSWEGGNREKEKNAIPNDLHVIQYLFLFGWKALKKEELWTGSWENLVLVLVSKWRDWTWGSNSVFWSSNSLSLAPVFLKQTFAVGLSCSFHSTGMAVLNLPANNLLPVDPEIVLKCSSYLMPDAYYSALNVYLSQALSWHPEKGVMRNKRERNARGPNPLSMNTRHHIY